MNIDKRLAKMEQIKSAKELDNLVAWVSKDYVEVSNGEGGLTEITLEEWEQRKKEHPDAYILEAVWV